MNEDAIVCCPECSRRVYADRLCEHDDPITGPLCPLCCPQTHERNAA